MRATAALAPSPAGALRLVTAPADSSGVAASGSSRCLAQPSSRLTVYASSQGRPALPPGPAAQRRRQTVPLQRHDQPPLLPTANNVLPGPHHHSPPAQEAQPAEAGMREAQDPAAEQAEGQETATAADRCSSSSSKTSNLSPTAAVAQPPGTSAAGLHRPVGLVVGSAWLLAASVQLAGVAGLAPLWLPAVAGGMLGGLYSVAHHHIGERRLWRAPAGPLRVVITGGSSGIGKALAREFLRCGDRVLVTSRSLAGAKKAVQELQEEAGPGVWVSGAECDVSDPASLDRLVDWAPAALGGGVQVWINNAGCSGSFQTLLSQTPEQVQQVVSTNLTGSLLATRAAMRHMSGQPGGGHIFSMEGAGADGSATPNYAVYGATKAAIAQLLGSLQHEAAALTGPGAVGVHNLSPGMVLTGLLLEGATPHNKQVFNILCEHPETVAAFLVPRVRSVVARGGSGAAIRYLTPARALAKLLVAPLHAGRYFDRHGQAVYPPERQRILGDRARRTRRLQQRAAQRSAPFQLAYALSMAASFFLIASDALAQVGGPGR